MPSLRSTILGALAVAPILIPITLRAQQMAAMPANSATVVVPAATVEQALATRVQVVLDNVSLTEALQVIARQGNIRVTLASPVMRETKRITLRADSITLRDAFGYALRETSIRMAVMPTGNVVFSPVVSARAENGTIVGKIIHAKTKQPVAGATVLLDGASKGVVSGDDGSFRIPANAGERIVHVRMVGFVQQTRHVTVTANETVTLNFSLEPSTSVLNEVVVTGTVVATERKAIATPITVITAEDIERRGITRVDQLMRGEIPGLLAAESGTDVYSDTLGAMAGVRMYSRGSSRIGVVTFANPIKTYVDGVELLDASYLGTIDPKSIERIEVITGPQAATIYGSGALGGVMQIFTKKGHTSATPDATIRLGYGVLQNNMSNGLTPTHNHSVMLTGGAGPAFSYSTTLSYVYSGQWQPNLFNRMYGASVGATHTAGPFVVSGSVTANSAANGTANSSSLSPYALTMRQSGEWGLVNYATAFTRRVSRAQNTMFSLNADYRALPIWQHHVTLGRAQNNFTMDPQRPTFATPSDTLYNTAIRNGQRNTVSYNTTLTPSSLGFLSTTLTVGMNGSFATQTGITGQYLSSSSTSLSNTNVDKPINDESWGGFGQWKVGFFNQFYVTLGLRGERNPSYGELHKIDWTPTTGVAYTVEMGDLSVKLLGSYGRATRAPAADRRLGYTTTSSFYTPSTYWFYLPNPDLTPEYESGPQGGIEVYYGNRGSLTLNHYKQTVRNYLWAVTVDSVLLTYIPTGAQSWQAQTQYQNLGRIDKFGWEATGQLNVGPFNVRGTYTWNESRVGLLYPGYTGATYYPGRSLMTGTPTHFGNVTVNYAHGGTSVALITQIMGRAARDNNTLLSHPVAIEWSSSRINTYVQRYSGVANWMQDGYAKSDLAVQQRFNAWATGTLNVKNLNNSTMSEFTIRSPSLGRQTQLGMMLKFPRRN